tara:strand:+ start:19 stop:231 length:213 start_codon:yes stop_codon:yes gene_type:complete
MNIEELTDRLNNNTELLKSARSNMNVLSDERNDLIAFARGYGFSAIMIANLLGITRQRVYKLLEKSQEVK